MNALVEHILNRNNINYKIKTVLADGEYDSNKSFGYLQNKNIQPAIRVRKNPLHQPHQKQQDKIYGSWISKKRSSEMEKEKKILKAMDG